MPQPYGFENGQAAPNPDAALRETAIAWLLNERAKMQEALDRLDAELAAIITADAEPNEKEKMIHGRFH